jgi:hypothetical protein
MYAKKDECTMSANISTDGASTQQNMSEVARLRQLIALEYEAAHRAIYDPAMVASHAIISAHMDNVTIYHQELVAYIGTEQATQVLFVVAEKAELESGQ